MASYKTIRLVAAFAEEKVDQQTCLKAVTRWMMEGIEEEAQRTVHFAFEGYKKPERLGGVKGRRGKDGNAHDNY